MKDCKENKKAGIVTLYGLYNHGNRLQNFAIQKMMMDRGYTCETIVCRKSRLRETARSCINWGKSLVGDADAIRYMNFSRFTKKHTNLSFLYEKTGLIPDKISQNYDYFIVGSDQVWNPEIRKKERNNFFLRFAHRNQRICLAPSIAVSELQPKYLREYVQGFNGFRYLSVREDSGADIIQKAVERQAEVIVDPTMMLSKQDWKSIYTPIQLPKQRYLLQIFLEQIDDIRKNRIQEIAKQLDAIVIDIADKKTPEYYTVAPDGFLQLIEHATLVCTDSFHAVAFSINFNTPFYAFSRISKKQTSNRMYSRIATILHKFSLENRTEDDLIQHGMTECDFHRANVKLADERKKFKKYLDKCLCQQQEPHIMNLDEEKCTGCGACMAACPTNCIKMRQDAEGFYAPFVDVGGCIDCGQCAKKCPVICRQQGNKHRVKAIAAYSKDTEVVEKSSSGGIFYYIASWIIEQGGIVYGAAFDENQKVCHISIERQEDICRLQGSKYVQSDIGDSYKQVKANLEQDRFVLFVGTPCQVSGLQSYLDREYEKLYICDFICHGVPSPEVWQRFLKENIAEDIISVNMRDKSSGWKNYSTKVMLADGDEWIKDRKSSPYNKAFESNISIKKSCFDCAFKGVERSSDITLGDFWGIERFYPDFMNAKGTSLLLLQTEKGTALLGQIEKYLTTQEVDLNIFLGKANTAMIRSPAMNPYRDIFFQHLDQPLSKYMNTIAVRCIKENNSFFNKLQRKVKRMIHS